MRKEAILGWVILILCIAMGFNQNVVQDAMYDSLTTLLLLIALCYGRTNDLLIYRYLLYLGIGKFIDSIQHPYLGFEFAEIVSIIVSSVIVGKQWWSKRKTQ